MIVNAGIVVELTAANRTNSFQGIVVLASSSSQFVRRSILGLVANQDLLQRLYG